MTQGNSRRLTVKANLARFTLALTIIASMAMTLGAGIQVKAVLRSQTTRILFVLASLASSALVVEAGRRWS